MQYRQIGKSGVMASAVGLGTWAIGGGGFWDGKDDDKEAVRTIEAALEQGITLIDTAPGYGDGKSETLVGQAIANVPRDKVVLSTKVGIIWWGDEGGYMHTLDGKKYYRNLEPGSMRMEVEKSLERMKTDHIDVLFTHWQSLPSFPTPIARTMQGLLDMKKEKLIRAIGVSNADLSQLKEYMDVGQLDVTQPAYSMINRTIEGEYLDYCMQNKIDVFAYSPLEQGLLTGRFSDDYQPPAGTYRADYLDWYKSEPLKNINTMLRGWQDLCLKYDATLAQLVIAWTIAQPGISFALCGARKSKHLLENVKGASLSLAQEDLLRMRADVERLA